MTELKIFGIMIAVFLLSGCLCPATQELGGNAQTGGDTAGDGSTGGGSANGDSVIIEQNNGGMSDPGKCNNLPPELMADCLEKAMGN